MREPIVGITSLDFIRQHVLAKVKGGEEIWIWRCDAKSACAQFYADDLTVWLYLTKPKPKPRPKVKASAKAAPKGKSKAKAAAVPDDHQSDEEGVVPVEDVFYVHEGGEEDPIDLDKSMLDAIADKEKKGAASFKAKATKSDMPSLSEASNATEEALKLKFSAVVAPTDIPGEDVDLTEKQGVKRLEDWHSMFRQSVVALRYRLSSLDRPLGEHDEMALVQHIEGGCKTVSFVNFPRNKTPSLIVFSSVHFRPWQSLLGPDTFVVMPAVGAAMIKAKGWLREFLPDEARIIQQMWQQQLAGGYHLVPGMRCSVCGFNDEHTRSCPVCLISTHNSCCIRVMHFATSRSFETASVLDILQRIFTLPGMCCPMCAEFIR